VAEKWEAIFREEAANFEAACLRPLRAFESSRYLTEQFYRAFDSAEVLPRDLQEEYEALKRSDSIRANELLVTVSYRRLAQLGQANRVADDYERQGPLVIDVPYDEEIGLDFSDLSAQSFGISFT